MISLVIPTLRVGNCLQKALDSMEGMYDQLIIIDEKMDNLGKKINKGLDAATGDYIIVANDDIVLNKGTLKDLCDPDYVTNPDVNGVRPFKVFHAHMSCFPRWVIKDESVRWPEDYDGWYYDDSDVWMQMINKCITPIHCHEVNIMHEHPGTTIGLSNNTERLKNNRELFIKKWGVQALGLTGNK